MNPLSFLQYIPENQREGFLSSLGVNGGQKGVDFSKAGNFAMQNFTPIAQGATSLIELGSNIFGGSGIDTDEIGNRMTTDLYSRPVYSYQDYSNSIDMLEDRSEAEVGRSIVSGVGSGVKSGAAIGSMIAPGIGTAVGAGIGALGGAIGGWLGGKKRKSEMSDEIANRENKLKESTKSFNQDNTNYFQSTQADSIESYLMAQRGRRLRF